MEGNFERFGGKQFPHKLKNRVKGLTAQTKLEKFHYSYEVAACQGDDKLQFVERACKL